MEVKRLGAYGGVYRLYDPRRQCLSVRLWFDPGRAERAARQARQERRREDFEDRQQTLQF